MTAPALSAARHSCCEVCDRSPSCGVDCGSCTHGECDACGGDGFNMGLDGPYVCGICKGTGVAALRVGEDK